MIDKSGWGRSDSIEQKKPEDRSPTIEKDFESTSRRVFAQYTDPYSKAAEEARMLWLAWRGDEKYVEVYLGDQAGRQSSWQFCDYHDLPGMIRRYKHVEARPVYAPFADHVLAFLVVLFQREVGKSPGADVYSRSSDPKIIGFVDKKIDCSVAYDVAKDGSEVVADWARRPGDVLKTRTMSVSPDRFSFFDYTRVGDKTPLASRGFIYVFKKQDRLAARRKNRQSAVRWIMSG